MAVHRQTVWTYSGPGTGMGTDTGAGGAIWMPECLTRWCVDAWCVGELIIGLVTARAMVRATAPGRLDMWVC